MYPVYIKTAEFQEEKGAVRTFKWALTTEKEHLKLFKRAKDAVDGGDDVELDDVQVCEVCGYTLEGEAPDKCPTCGAKKEKFKTFEA
jgi:rubrerythrin